MGKRRVSQKARQLREIDLGFMWKTYNGAVRYGTLQYFRCHSTEKVRLEGVVSALPALEQVCESSAVNVKLNDYLYDEFWTLQGLSPLTNKQCGCWKIIYAQAAFPQWATIYTTISIFELLRARHSRHTGLNAYSTSSKAKTTKWLQASWHQMWTTRSRPSCLKMTSPFGGKAGWLLRLHHLRLQHRRRKLGLRTLVKARWQISLIDSSTIVFEWEFLVVRIMPQKEIIYLYHHTYWAMAHWWREQGVLLAVELIATIFSSASEQQNESFGILSVLRLY